MNKTVKINGMMCEHCEKKVTEALKPFAEEVLASHINKQASLKNTNLDNNKIKEIIENLGFEVEEIIEK